PGVTVVGQVCRGVVRGHHPRRRCRHRARHPAAPNEDAMTTVAPAPTTAVPDEREIVSKRPPGGLRVAFRMWRTRVGMIIVTVLVLFALFGRYVAPYGERGAVGLPFQPRGETPKPTVV